MKKVSDLFQKYKATLRPPQASVEKQTVAIISQVTGLLITSQYIRYSPATRTITIKAPSILRTEILQKRSKILAALQTELGVKNAPTELL